MIARFLSKCTTQKGHAVRGESLSDVDRHQARLAANPEVLAAAMERMQADPTMARLAGRGAPDAATMRRVAEAMRANPGLQRQVEATMERLFSDPQAYEALMAGAGGLGGGLPGLPPGFPPPGMLAGFPPGGLGGVPPSGTPAATPPTPTPPPTTTTTPAAPGSAPASGGAAASGDQQVDTNFMTEEEALLEAIRRSLREQ